MRIYTMTATFGKLEHQTLSFTEGLNVISAPNEWGKSTWCAFLVSMLYGIDTRERTKGRSIADKERYAPWSGAPMSGRMDIAWNGRDITIERRTKGRSIFGDFKAYETATGLPIPELTATNCGQVLLGVEKSVFTRAGFIRLTDMPVSDDEALRRRLNALVTTGDESGASDDLEQKLRDLKNRCRYNRSGLLPQAEAQRAELAAKLQQLQQLRDQQVRLNTRLRELEQQLGALENHKIALAYEASREDARRVDAAKAACDRARAQYEAQSALCQTLPDRETAQEHILQLEQLRMQLEALQAEKLPPQPQKPDAPAAFAHMTPEQALQQAKQDKEALDKLSKPGFPVSLLLSGACVLNAVLLAIVADWRFALPFPIFALLFVIAHIRGTSVRKKERQQCLDRYPGLAPEDWIATAQNYSDAVAAYAAQEAAHRVLCDNLQSRKDSLADNIAHFTGGNSVNECLDGWRETLLSHQALETACTAWEQAKAHASALEAVAKVAPAPEFADPLTWSAEQTEAQLDRTKSELQQLQHQSGQYQGQMETLGLESALQQQLEAVQARIDRLEEIYAAASLAMQTLGEAANQLQRKFAPKISSRAQALFAKLTAQRYDRLVLGEDLSLQACARDEDTLRSDLWRSDGTADQLYLALRLAVAEELTPGAPLVLDDALVRFDDARLASAMEILKAGAQDRQVIVFSCQDRERQYL